jgi:lysophospholipase L1-like esterase
MERSVSRVRAGAVPTLAICALLGACGGGTADSEMVMADGAEGPMYAEKRHANPSGKTKADLGPLISTAGPSIGAGQAATTASEPVTPLPPTATAQATPGISAAVSPAIGAAVPPAISAAVPPAISAAVPPAMSAAVPPAMSAAVSTTTVDASLVVPRGEPVVQPAHPPSPESNWYLVAREGQTYDGPSLGNVRIGVPGNWTYKVLGGPFTCVPSLFGVAAVRTLLKQCQTDNPIARERMVKVMPLGDSITAMFGYKEALWKLIRGAGLNGTDFVGNAPYGYLDDPNSDPDNNGYGGYVVRNLLRPAGDRLPVNGYLSDERDLEVWLRGQTPDLVLMHFGTNDAWGGANADDVLAAYSKILVSLRQKNPRVVFVVAQLIPMALADCLYCDGVVRNLNAAIPGWANRNSTVESPILVVDQHTGFDARALTRDGVHPNPAGAQQMADRFFRVIRSYLK